MDQSVLSPLERSRIGARHELLAASLLAVETHATGLVFVDEQHGESVASEHVPKMPSRRRLLAPESSTTFVVAPREQAVVSKFAFEILDHSLFAPMSIQIKIQF